MISDRRPADLIREVARTAPPRLVALVRKTAGGRGRRRRPGRWAPRAAPVAPRASGPRPPRGQRRAVDGRPATRPATISEAPEIIVRPGKADAAADARGLHRAAGDLPRAHLLRQLLGACRATGCRAHRASPARWPFIPGPAWAPGPATSAWSAPSSRSLGATTQNQPGAAPSPTRHLAYRVGVRARVPVAIATLLLGADYGEQHFTLQRARRGVMSPESPTTASSGPTSRAASPSGASRSCCRAATCTSWMRPA